MLNIVKLQLPKNEQLQRQQTCQKRGRAFIAEWLCRSDGFDLFLDGIMTCCLRKESFSAQSIYPRQEKFAKSSGELFARSNLRLLQKARPAVAQTRPKRSQSNFKSTYNPSR